MAYEKLYLVVIVFIFTNIANAQITISGKVTDYKENVVSYALIILIDIKDSAIVSYTNTDDNGDFSIKTHRKGNFVLKISNLSYKTQTKEFSINENTGKVIELNFVLEDNIIPLNEITIKERYSGIHYGQDTIRYNPKVFTDGSERVLGDVLNKLPGVEVDSKGNIKAHGKQVDKLLLNGQDFFANNTQMATKNLPANIAESVEVLNNYSEYSLFNGFQSHNQTAINIGVNKNNLGQISGNISAGGGIENKYKTNVNLMRMASKSMITFIGAQNNTGDEVFSFEDYIRLQGGANEVFGNNGFFNLTEDELRLLMPSDNIYSKTNGLSALNLSYQSGNKFKLNSYALFNRDRTEEEDINRYVYNLPDGENVTALENIAAKTKNGLFSGYLKTNYNPSSSLSLAYSGDISNSMMKRENNILNESENKQLFNYGVRNINHLRTKHNLLMMKAIGAHLLLSNLKLSYSDNPIDYSLKTDSLLLPIPLTLYNDWYYGRQDIHEKQLSGELSVAFLYRLNENYYLRSVLGTEIKRQTYASFISENIPSESIVYLGDSLHNSLNFNLYDYYGNLELIKNKRFFQFKAGVSAHIYNPSGNIAGQISYKKLQLNPTLELSLFFSEKHRLTTILNKVINTNPINDFADNIVINSHNAYRSNGLFDYLYNSQHNVQLIYNLDDRFSNTMLLFSGMYNRTKHSATKNYFQDGVLSVINSILSPPKENLLLNFTVIKGFGFAPWRLSYKGRYMNNKYSYMVDEQENKVNSQIINNQLKVESRYRFPLNAEIYLGWNQADNSISSGYKINQSVWRYGGKIKFKANNRFYADAEFELRKNKMPNYSQNKYIVNGSVRYILCKNIEIQLCGYNILNLYGQTWSSVSYSGNYSLERFYNQIPGNIVFNIKYMI
jgi:hypothetical protein